MSYLVNGNNELILSAFTAMDNIEIHNIIGQQVISQKLNNINEIIDISSLITGVYIAIVNIEGQSKSFKIVKK